MTLKVSQCFLLTVKNLSKAPPTPKRKNCTHVLLVEPPNFLWGQLGHLLPVSDLGTALARRPGRPAGGDAKRADQGHGPRRGGGGGGGWPAHQRRRAVHGDVRGGEWLLPTEVNGRIDVSSQSRLCRAK